MERNKLSYMVYTETGRVLAEHIVFATHYPLIKVQGFPFEIMRIFCLQGEEGTVPAKTGEEENTMQFAGRLKNIFRTPEKQHAGLHRTVSLMTGFSLQDNRGKSCRCSHMGCGLEWNLPETF